MEQNYRKGVARSKSKRICNCTRYCLVPLQRWVLDYFAFPPANGKMYFFHGLIKRVRSQTWNFTNLFSEKCYLSIVCIALMSQVEHSLIWLWAIWSNNSYISWNKVFQKSQCNILLDQSPMISWCFFPTVAFILIVLKIFIYHVNLIETMFLLQNYIWITGIDKVVLHADY